MRRASLALGAALFVLSILGPLSAQRPAFAKAAAGRPAPSAYLDAAFEAARWVRGSAVKTPAGLTWPADPADPQSVNVTKYLDAALAGARYLQAIAKTDGNVCLIPHNQPDGLDLFYLGWCHGPTGTARLWYRLAKATGDASWMEWVGKSARAIAQSGIPETRTPGFWNNVSQCCGSAGVAQFFLALHAVTRDPQYLDFAKRMTADLLARGTRDEKGLRWIQAEHRVRPELLVAQTGYMQGAAGIGMWLLRLDAAERGRKPFVRFPDTPF